MHVSLCVCLCVRVCIYTCIIIIILYQIYMCVLPGVGGHNIIRSKSGWFAWILDHPEFATGCLFKNVPLSVADPGGGGAQRVRAPPPPPPPPPLSPRVPPLRIHVHVRLCVREHMQTQRRDIATAEMAYLLYTYAYVHNDTWVRAKYEYDCIWRFYHMT